uniref:Uncharacterized protein n=1 Tax=Zooxanthella nutricula TaxID=1333877 RepID=A0A7S2VR60_9DINO
MPPAVQAGLGHLDFEVQRLIKRLDSLETLLATVVGAERLAAHRHRTDFEIIKQTSKWTNTASIKHLVDNDKGVTRTLLPLLTSRSAVTLQIALGQAGYCQELQCFGARERLFHAGAAVVAAGAEATEEQVKELDDAADTARCWNIDNALVSDGLRTLATVQAKRAIFNATSDEALNAALIQARRQSRSGGGDAHDIDELNDLAAKARQRLSRVEITAEVEHRLMVATRWNDKDKLLKAIKFAEDRHYSGEQLDKVKEMIRESEQLDARNKEKAEAFRRFLAAAKPQWQLKELEAATSKLATLGVCIVEDMTTALDEAAPRHLNDRLRDKGLRAFSDETLAAFEAALNIGA